jgi:hypothetical protein
MKHAIYTLSILLQIIIITSYANIYTADTLQPVRKRSASQPTYSSPARTIYCSNLSEDSSSQYSQSIHSLTSLISETPFQQGFNVPESSSSQYSQSIHSLTSVMNKTRSQASSPSSLASYDRIPSARSDLTTTPTREIINDLSSISDHSLSENFRPVSPAHLLIPGQGACNWQAKSQEFDEKMLLKTIQDQEKNNKALAELQKNFRNKSFIAVGACLTICLTALQLKSMTTTALEQEQAHRFVGEMFLAHSAITTILPTILSIASAAYGMHILNNWLYGDIHNNIKDLRNELLEEKKARISGDKNSLNGLVQIAHDSQQAQEILSDITSTIGDLKRNHRGIKEQLEQIQPLINNIQLQTQGLHEIIAIQDISSALPDTSTAPAEKKAAQKRWKMSLPNLFK